MVNTLGCHLSSVYGGLAYRIINTFSQEFSVLVENQPGVTRLPGRSMFSLFSVLGDSPD